MFTATDLAGRYSVHVKTIYKWSRSGILPAPVEIRENVLRWREQDIALWEDYLAARVSAKSAGIDPNSPEGPAPPVYSTGCRSFDARQQVAQQKEKQRRSGTDGRKAKPEVPVTYEGI